MPLRYAIVGDGRIEVQQTFESPTVYLDHWAIRRLSDETQLQQRFVHALHDAGGTLVLTYLSLAEFVVVEDERHAERAGAFLDEVLPNIYFSKFDLDEAINQEVNPKARHCKLAPPPPDIDLLRMAALANPGIPQPFSVKMLFTEVATNRNCLEPKFNAMNRRVAARLSELRNDPNFVEEAGKSKPDESIPRTLLVMREILRNLFLDPNTPITENDAADIQHAILSTAYCDYVLLDGRWEHMIQQMKQRILKLKQSITVARCFSERRNGLENFLLALEARASI